MFGEADKLNLKISEIVSLISLLKVLEMLYSRPFCFGFAVSELLRQLH